MEESSPNFISPKIELRTYPEKGGYGIFARASFKKDEVIIAWGGLIVNSEKLLSLSEYKRIHSLQIEEDLFEVPFTDDDPADMVNHSCDPNAGISGQIVLVAYRDIQPGEEICFDYAMSDSNPYDEFNCQCGSALCRGKVRGDDWKRPELQERYHGYFSTYLQRRIDRLQK
ncbi:MAG: SET domain-containing protein [Anaerolineae bacterium]|nr:SET domain-containing protein [Anaerolineae bacterium]